MTIPWFAWLSRFLSNATALADGGDTGLRALEGAGFDLKIVDIFMPHMRGFESIRIFHERAPKVPLIAMSGYAFANLDSPAPDFPRMALELGATRCLRKPFTPMALRSSMNASPKLRGRCRIALAVADSRRRLHLCRVARVRRTCRLGSVYHKWDCRFYLGARYLYGAFR
jgi:CheY-like chemotaxis protein